MLKNDAVLLALECAEQMKGRPVHILDIQKELIELQQKGRIMLPDLADFANTTLFRFIFDLVRNDQILSDKMMEYFSIDPLNQCTEGNRTKFELCSDRLAKDLTNYVFDERGRVRPGPETATINFDCLKKHLLISGRD